jgi:peptide-methionine (S)-S-oxide reductase
MSSSSPATAPAPAGAASAIFAGGCFWCVEAPYAALRGVHSATSGYIGGHAANPSYADVCAGETGHAEAVRVLFDPAAISFDALLDVFFTLHDPTQLNRQGNDHGTQYRSAIFYADEAQRAAALEKIRALRAKLPSDVVTQLEPASEHTWYPAEEYHQVRGREGAKGAHGAVRGKRGARYEARSEPRALYDARGREGAKGAHGAVRGEARRGRRACD